MSRRLTVAMVSALAGAAAGVSLLAPSAAVAATYHVSTTGSDAAGGSASAPWRTIKKSMEALEPGDTLLVRGGTYTERVTGVDIRQGTPSAPITVRAHPGERPVLSGLLSLYSPSHWTLDGLDVAWDPENADHGSHMVRLIDGTGWRITNSVLSGARAYSALLIGGSARDWRLDHNVIRDTYHSNDLNQDHLVYINTPVGGGVVERNLFRGSPNGRGIKIGPPSGGTSAIGGVTVRYNTFSDNTGPSNVQLSYGASDNRIYRNIMVRAGSSYANVTAYNLNGSGNEVFDNVGWLSSRVHDSTSGLSDRGGNLHADPLLDGDLRPQKAFALAFGRYAEGDEVVAPQPPVVAPGPLTPNPPAPAPPGRPPAAASPAAGNPFTPASVTPAPLGRGAAGATLAHDTFSRAVADGWGPAQVGGIWKRLTGAASAFTVADGEARLRVNRHARLIHLRDAVARDVDVRMEVSFAAVKGSGASAFAGAVLRRRSGGDHDRVGLLATAGGRLLLRGNTGDGTSLFEDADTRLGFRAGRTYELRVQATGGSPTTVRAKAWRAGTAEPGGWQAVRSTAAGPQGAGSSGVATSTARTSADVLVEVDDFFASTAG